MNRDIATKVQRIKDRAKMLCEDMAKGDPIRGMANAAELSTIADFLWQDFRKLVDQSPPISPVKIRPVDEQG